MARPADLSRGVFRLRRTDDRSITRLSGRRRAASTALRPSCDCLESRIAPAGLGPAEPYNFFILGAMNSSNTDVEGRLAIGGAANLLNFSTASRFAGENGGRGTANALVSGTFLTYTNGTIHGDLHYNDNAVNLTRVAVTGNTFPNSTPIDFGSSRTTLASDADYWATVTPNGAVSRVGTTLTLTGSPSNSLNVFSVSSLDLAAARHGRLNITNVDPASTVLINVDGAAVSMTFMDFQLNGVGGDNPFARRILYNLYQATSLTINAASPVGSILAPRADASGGSAGGHIAGTLITSTLQGFLEGHHYPFEGNLPEPPGPTPTVDLSVAKSVTDSRPNVGQSITYTVTIANAGPDTANNVLVSEPLADGALVLSTDPSQGTFDADTGVWSVGTLAANATATLRITCAVGTCDPIVNTASLVSSEPADSDPSDNSSTVTVTPLSADLQLTATADTSSPTVGETVTYTVTATNLGPDPAGGVVLDGLLSTLLRLDTYTVSQGSLEVSSGRWTVGSLATGGVATLVLHTTAIAAGAGVSSAEVVSLDIADCNPDNNSVALPITVQPRPSVDLEVVKTVDDTRPNVGQTIRYTVTVRNLGPGPAGNIVVSEPIPHGMTVSSATPSQGAFDPESGTWNVGDLTPDAAATLELVCVVATCDPVQNTASLVSSDPADSNPDNDQSSQTVTPLNADLAMTKVVDNATPVVGDTVVFTATLSNLGPDPSVDVIVTDRFLNSLLSFVSALPSQGTFDPGTGAWNVGTLAAGASVTLKIAATAESTGLSGNHVIVASTDTFDCVPGNGAATVIVLIGDTPPPPEADLAVDKAIVGDVGTVGTNATFVVTITNDGPGDAAGVVVADAIPSGVGFVSAAPSQGTYDPSTGLWAVGGLVNGASATLLVTVLLAECDPITNTATIITSSAVDPDPTNDTASLVITPLQADLQISATVAPSSPVVGGTVVYTVTITNLGPETSTGVVVEGLVSDLLRLDSADPSQGTVDAALRRWSVGALDPGATATLVLHATAIAAGSGVSSAVVVSIDIVDCFPDNNFVSLPITVQPAPPADLEVAKTVSNARPNVGDSITYTVTVRNAGEGSVASIVLSDTIPHDLVVSSSDPSQGTFDPDAGLWIVGTLAPGATATLQIICIVSTCDPLQNTAALVSSDPADPNAADDSSTVTVTPLSADLQLSATLTPVAIIVGTAATYTLTVRNLGPDPAGSIIIDGLLSSLVRLDSAVPSQGTVDAANGLWSVGTIAPGGSATLLLGVTAIGAGSGISSAAVLSMDVADCNPDGAVVVLPLFVSPPPSTDLAVGKSVDNAQPTVGTQVTFTVSVRNLGFITATGVVLADSLPPGLTFVSATPSQGTYDSTTGVWTVGAVDPGFPQTLTIIAAASVTSSQTNTATLTHLDQIDTNPNNDTASVVVVPVAVSPEVISVRRVGFHAQPTQFIVTFNAPLDPSSAQDVSHYTLTTQVGRRTVTIPISSATYDPSTNSVTLRTRRPLPLHRQYTLTVSGVLPAAVLGLNGLPIDGNSDGTPGGNFTLTFGREILLLPNRTAARPGGALPRSSLALDATAADAALASLASSGSRSVSSRMVPRKPAGVLRSI